MANALPIGISPIELRPTQMTLGFRAVEVKRRQWHEGNDGERAKILRRHVVPAVAAERSIFHRRSSPFHEGDYRQEGRANRRLRRRNLSDLDKDELWTVLDNRAWCHAYNAKGQRRLSTDIPTSLTELADDPYRSFAGELIWYQSPASFCFRSSRGRARRRGRSSRPA